MAKKISRIRIKTPKIKKENGIISKLKFAESYTSLIFGAIVVLVIGILFVSFAKTNRDPQTSSIMNTPKTWEQLFQDTATSSTYTVRPGDDLWTISVNTYNDGYRWVEIAKINNLVNPGLIQAGDKLVIPAEDSSEQIVSGSNSLPLTQDSKIANNSIMGSTYTVKSGDCLWDIAIRAYGDGYRWPELARVNNIVNPDLIYPNTVLQIPR